MILAFELSMPNCGSWDGRWSGAGKKYVLIQSFRGKAATEAARLVGRSFHYSFGDGWIACVSVREVDRGEARRLKAVSAGFAGYGWMVEEIVKHGEILPLTMRGRRT